MSKISKLAVALMASGLVAAPFAALAQANDDAVAVSLSAKMTGGDNTTITADQTKVEVDTGQVDFFASAAATGALAIAGSQAEDDKVGATAGAIAPGVTDELEEPTTAVYDAASEGKVTLTFDLSGD